MNLYINPSSTPPAVQLKASSSPISSMRLKRGAVVPLNVTLMGVENATDLRLGIKASYEGDLLALAWADAGTLTDNGICFELPLHVQSEALDSALHVGDAESPLSKLTCMAEFAWVENGDMRVSDTISTTILNDIVRMATAPSLEGEATIYPAPDDIATKEWVASFLDEEGLSSEEVQDLIDDTLILPTTVYTTPTGTDNATFLWVDIPAKYLNAGSISSISLKAGSDSTGMATQAVYLCIHQMTAVMDVWEGVAVSTNSQIFGINKTLEWKFSNATLNGNRIRLCLLTTRASGAIWRETINFRASCTTTTKWQEGYLRTSTGDLLALPQLVITMATPHDRYAASEHTRDSVAHLTADEHTGLTAILGIKEQLLAAFPATATTEEPEADEMPPGMEAYISPDDEESDSEDAVPVAEDDETTITQS